MKSGMAIFFQLDLSLQLEISNFKIEKVAMTSLISRALIESTDSEIQKDYFVKKFHNLHFFNFQCSTFSLHTISTCQMNSY
jgi:hypothetical protein